MEPVVTTLDELMALDGTELTLGYTEGMRLDPLPADASPAYKHGWRNAQQDRGLLERKEVDYELARQYLNMRRAQRERGV